MPQFKGRQLVDAATAALAVKVGTPVAVFCAPVVCRCTADVVRAQRRAARRQARSLCGAVVVCAALRAETLIPIECARAHVSP